MKGLVEQKLKKLHYFPPQFRVQAPHTLLAAHPLLSDVPPRVFRRKVGGPLIRIPPLHTLTPFLLYKDWCAFVPTSVAISRQADLFWFHRAGVAGGARCWPRRGCGCTTRGSA